MVGADVAVVVLGCLLLGRVWVGFDLSFAFEEVALSGAGPVDVVWVENEVLVSDHLIHVHEAQPLPQVLLLPCHRAVGGRIELLPSTNQ